MQNCQVRFSIFVLKAQNVPSFTLVKLYSVVGSLILGLLKCRMRLTGNPWGILPVQHRTVVHSRTFCPQWRSCYVTNFRYTQNLIATWGHTSVHVVTSSCIDSLPVCPQTCWTRDSCEFHLTKDHHTTCLNKRLVCKGHTVLSEIIKYNNSNVIDKISMLLIGSIFVSNSVFNMKFLMSQPTLNATFASVLRAPSHKMNWINFFKKALQKLTRK
jgi:hypothetical protein